MKKKIIDVSFVLVMGAILILLLEYDLLQEYIGFILIPIISAYFFGQYIERRFNQHED